MATIATTIPGRKPLPVHIIILKATLLAGCLDIISAMLHFYIRTNKNPVSVLKFVASAVFGTAAFEGGTLMAAMGLLFHFIVTFIWVIIFVIIYSKFIVIIKNSVVAGFVYAIFIWVVMSFVVVPLSNAPSGTFNFIHAMAGLLILMFAVGLPISLVVSRHYNKA